MPNYCLCSGIRFVIAETYIQKDMRVMFVLLKWRNVTRWSCLNGTVLELKRLLLPMSRFAMYSPPSSIRATNKLFYLLILLSWNTRAHDGWLFIRIVTELDTYWHSSRYGYGSSYGSFSEVRCSRTCHACVVFNHVVGSCSMLRSSSLISSLIAV